VKNICEGIRGNGKKERSELMGKKKNPLAHNREAAKTRKVPGEKFGCTRTYRREEFRRALLRMGGS